MAFKLTVINGSAAGQAFDLKLGHTLVIGRGADCDIQLTDPHASRMHCKLTYEKGRATVVDAGSSWGTVVNGDPISSADLRPGDVIGVGKTMIRFDVISSGALDATIPPGTKLPPLEIPEGLTLKTPGSATAPEAGSESPERPGKSPGGHTLDISDDMGLKPTESMAQPKAQLPSTKENPEDSPMPKRLTETVDYTPASSATPPSTSKPSASPATKEKPSAREKRAVKKKSADTGKADTGKADKKDRSGKTRSETSPSATEPYSPQPASSKPAAGKGEADELPPCGSVRLQELVGHTLVHYKLQKFVNKGKTGAVFKALDLKKDRPVAIKILWPEISKEDEEVQRFIRAVKTMMPIKHENLIALYGAGKTKGYCWMAMEYVEGESVAQYIKRAGVGGMLDWRRAFLVALHVARALQAAYDRNVIHRNIMPNNILIRASDKVAKLGDLMLAKALEGSLAAKVTKPGELVGSLSFMAPEQTLEAEDVDTRADIYNLGAAVYAMLTGHPPFEGRTPAEIINKLQIEPPEPPTKYHMSIPPMLEGIVLKMLMKRPVDRYDKPSDVVRELERFGKFQGLEGF